MTSPATKPPTFYCRELSRDSDEQLFGAASRVDVWFLLEYTGGWAPKPLPGAEFAGAVKDHLEAGVRRVRWAKLLFIKQSPTLRDGYFSFYAAISNRPRPLLYRFRFRQYEELLGLDLPRLAAARFEETAAEAVDALFLVCTHGRRDKCCAKFGLPVYEAAAAHAGGDVWQSSHIGGDRFAGNLVCLPHGVYYGHVDQDAPSIVDEYRLGRMRSTNYRGRSSYTPTVQAAEYFLRLETGTRELGAFDFLSLARIEGQTWEAIFAGNLSGRIHTVRFLRNPSALHNPLTCALNEADIPQHTLISHVSV